MGQYLAIGLVTKQNVEKANLAKYKISQQELVEKMEADLHFKPEIYTFSEQERTLQFTLKEDVLSNQLIPFLESFYPTLYRDNDYIKYEAILEKLKETDANKWLELAEDKHFEGFQHDSYGEGDVLYFKKDFRPTVSIHYQSILLSMEGKIIMETYGRQFSFFTHCMATTFSAFPIAGALRVYITG